MWNGTLTLQQFILQQERLHPEATGEFTKLLTDIALATKMINAEVIRAGLVDILGYTGRENVHGEKVQRLDQFAHETLNRVLGRTGQLAVLVSEEDEDIVSAPEDQPAGKYVLNFDPLDGSSNINANVNIGTIFSVLARVTREGRGTLQDCLQPGHRQLCAGYVMYGSSTMLVYTAGHGVHGFTFEPTIGEFLLSHPDIRTPPRGRIYSVNEGNYFRWADGPKRYVDWLKIDDPATHRPYSARYAGSLVADFHRNLLYGGIFLYPGDRRNPQGKLRVLYEAAPLAFVAEAAGGAASDGRRRILDIEPTAIHQRTPLILGSREDVSECEQFIQETHSAITAERRIDRRTTAPPVPAVVLAALALGLLPTAPSFGRVPEQHPIPSTTAVKAPPSASPAQPAPTTLPTPAPVPALPPAQRAPDSIKPRPGPEIEGTYSVSGSAAEVSVRRLFGDVYYLTSSESWEGVGILEGPDYRGVFRYRGGPDPQLNGVTGLHTIDWSSPDSPNVQAVFTSLRSGQFDQRWRRTTASGERPVLKPLPPAEPPRESTATPGHRPAIGEYVYVEVLPEAVTKVAPPYPESARQARIEGTVLVQALVLEDGTVGECRVVRSVPGLDEAAVASVRQWRFKPAMSKGVPVAVWVATPVKFSLH